MNSRVKSLSFLLSVLLLNVLFGYFIFAWQAPTQTPPSGNVPAPVQQQGNATLNNLIANTLTVNSTSTFSATSTFQGGLVWQGLIKGTNITGPGAGSGLDADLLDGLQASDILEAAGGAGKVYQCLFTSKTYQGNLGGEIGGDAKCQAEFGEGWYFGYPSQFFSLAPGLSDKRAWVNIIGESGAACESWSSSVVNSVFNSVWVDPTSNRWSLAGGQISCSTYYPLVCCNWLPPETRKLVFITHYDFTGRFRDYLGYGASGGNAGDSLCQKIASEAGLRGTFKAWISGSVVSDAPVNRFVHSDLPYIKLNGIKVANNWQDLTDGSLQSVIDISEKGVTKTSHYVWTNTLKDGTRKSNFDTCNDWQSNSPYEQGYIGCSQYIDTRWTDFSKTNCAFQNNLYCFQQ